MTDLLSETSPAAVAGSSQPSDWRAQGLAALGVSPAAPFAVRRAGQELGRDLALRISDVWDDARAAAAGPIDVLDLFSGCGGMSAGFMAANAAAPFFRLAGAFDNDAVAN